MLMDSNVHVMQLFWSIPNDAHYKYYKSTVETGLAVP